MNGFKLVVLFLAAIFAGGIVLAAQAADRTAPIQNRTTAPQQSSDCTDLNPTHIVTIDQDSEQDGFAFAVPDGPTFYGGSDGRFLTDPYVNLLQKFPLAESLATGLYVVRAEWFEGVPTNTANLWLSNPSGTSQRWLFGGTVDVHGSPVIKWGTFQVQDLLLSVVMLRPEGSLNWAVDIWKVDCLPWHVSNVW